MPLLRPVPFEPGQKHRHWRFEEDWFYNRWKYTVLIPQHTVIDGASVPKFFSNIFSPTGILFIGACLHDFGYEKAFLLKVVGEDITPVIMTRKELDDMFGEVSRLHYPDETWAINNAEACLEFGGQEAWDNCRKADGSYVEPEPVKTDTNEDWMV